MSSQEPADHGDILSTSQSRAEDTANDDSACQSPANMEPHTHSGIDIHNNTKISTFSARTSSSSPAPSLSTHTHTHTADVHAEMHHYAMAAQRSISSKSPVVNPKSSIATKQSPIVTQKSPIFTQKSPVVTQKSPPLLSNHPSSEPRASTSLVGPHAHTAGNAAKAHPIDQQVVDSHRRGFANGDPNGDPNGDSHEFSNLMSLAAVSDTRAPPKWAFVPSHEPYTLLQEPYNLSTELCVPSQKPSILPSQNSDAPKEPAVPRKEPYILADESSVASKVAPTMPEARTQTHAHTYAHTPTLPHDVHPLPLQRFNTPSHPPTYPPTNIPNMPATHPTTHTHTHTKTALMRVQQHQLPLQLYGKGSPLTMHCKRHPPAVGLG